MTVCALTKFLPVVLLTLVALCVPNGAPCKAVSARATTSTVAQSRTIYLASPLGFSEAGRTFKATVLRPLLERSGYIVVDPWELTPAKDIQAVEALADGAERKIAWQKLDRWIGDKNAAALAGSDIVVAVLDGADVDSGTASEIGFAASMHKPIVGYRGDFRLAADNEGASVNLQVESFIKRSGGEIVRSVSELPLALKNISADRFKPLLRSDGTIVPPVFVTPADKLSQDVDVTRDIADIVDFVKKAFTIILALAFGEALKQFVADRSDAGNRHISWNRAPALLTFLLLLFPFFQGMYRYLFEVYQDQAVIPPDYGVRLLIDGIVFTSESAIFFVMSRALDPAQFRRFVGCVLCLVIVDAAWAVSVLYYSPLDRHIINWLSLDVTVAIIMIMALVYLNPRHIGSDGFRTAIPLWPIGLTVLSLIRTAVDYALSWDYYFPGS